MSSSRILVGLVVFVIVAGAACGSGASSATPTPVVQVKFVTPTKPTVVPAPTVSSEVPTPVAADEWQEYTVRPSDNLWSIAQRYGLTVQDLVKANDIKDPNRLAVGQKLRIPPRATPTPAP